jgi:2-dehydropantoate 2-reductase
MALEEGKGRESLTITLVGRQGLVDKVQATGLALHEGKDEVVTHPRAVVAIDPAPSSRCDLVLLTVRTYDVAASVPDVRALIGSEGFVLALQNGVGSEEELAAALGCDRVLVGTLTASVGMPQPGIVARQSRGGGLALATMDGGALPPWIVDTFRSSGLSVATVRDYRSLRWSKLLLNMLGAATGAILDLDPASLVASPSLFRIEQLALREAARAMDAQGVRTVSLPGYPVELVRLGMRLPLPLARRTVGARLARARGGRSPTMRADVARGKTEVRYLNGAVVRAATELGLEAPVNAALTELTEEVAHNPERRAEFRGQPDRLLSFLADRGVR